MVDYIHLVVATNLNSCVVSAYCTTRYLNIIIEMRTNSVYCLISRIILRHRHLTPIQLHVSKTNSITTTYVDRLSWLDSLVHDKGSVLASFIFKHNVTIIHEGNFRMQ